MPTLNEASPEEVQRILASDQFVLIPSDSESQYKIHRGLLKSLSPAFHSTSEGGWAETESGSHKFLSNLDGTEAAISQDVVVCFIAWAYLGNYHTEAVGVSSPTPEVVRSPKPSKLSKKEQKRYMAMQGWQVAVEPEPEPEPEPAPAPAPAPEDEAMTAEDNDDVTPDRESASTAQATNSQAATNQIHYLLLNAQIYVFANIYLIEGLKAVAQQKITSYLERNSTGNLDSTQPILDMLDYASTHLPEDDELLDRLAKYARSRLDLFRSDKARWNAIIGRDEGKLAKLVMEYVFTTPNVVSECPYCGNSISRYY